MRMQVRSLALLSGLMIQHSVGVVWVKDAAQIPCCCGCGVGWQLQLRFDPSLGTSVCCRCSPKKIKKKKKFPTFRILYRAKISFNTSNIVGEKCSALDTFWRQNQMDWIWVMKREIMDHFKVSVMNGASNDWDEQTEIADLYVSDTEGWWTAETQIWKW